MSLSQAGAAAPPAAQPALTPFRMSSLLSLHFMNRTIFQLVLQLTELTWKEPDLFLHAHLAAIPSSRATPHSPAPLRSWAPWVPLTHRKRRAGKGALWRRELGSTTGAAPPSRTAALSPGRCFCRQRAKAQRKRVLVKWDGLQRQSAPSASSLRGQGPSSLPAAAPSSASSGRQGGLHAHGRDRTPMPGQPGRQTYGPELRVTFGTGTCTYRAQELVPFLPQPPDNYLSPSSLSCVPSSPNETLRRCIDSLCDIHTHAHAQPCWLTNSPQSHLQPEMTEESEP